MASAFALLLLTQTMPLKEDRLASTWENAIFILYFEKKMFSNCFILVFSFEQIRKSKCAGQLPLHCLESKHSRGAGQLPRSDDLEMKRECHCTEHTEKSSLENWGSSEVHHSSSS